MKIITISKTKIIVCAIILLSIIKLDNLFATVITSSADGNWSATSTWIGGIVPTSIDSVVIGAEQRINIDGADTCLYLVMTVPGTGASDDTRIINDANILVVNGDVVMDREGSTSSYDIDIILRNGGMTSILGNILINSTVSGGCSIDMRTGSGNELHLGGDLVVTGLLTIRPGTGSTLVLNGINAQTLNFPTGGSFHDVIFNNTSASGVILSDAITATNIKGSITIQTGILDNGGYSIVGDGSEALITTPNTELRLTGTSSFPTGFGTITFEDTSLLHYSGMDQTVASGDFYDMEISGSGTKTLGGAVSIRNSLILTASTLVSGGNVTINSSSTRTAQIVPGLGSITGDVIIERYISGSAAWHLISPTVSGETIDGYDDDLTINGLIGGDNPTESVSFYTHDETLMSGTNPDTGWVPGINVSSSINQGQGYLAYIFGADLPATLDLVGPVTTGNHVFPISYTNTGDINNDGWNLVGNPYPFPIDWDASSGWTRTGMTSSMEYYDANVDAYRGYNHFTNQPINGGSQYIPSHQGYWVQVNDAKNDFQSTNEVRSTMTDSAVSPDNFLRLNLLKANYAMEIYINFIDGATNGLDGLYDSYQLKSLDSLNTNAYLASIVNDSLKMSINSFPNDWSKNYDIPLYIDVKTDTIYTINVLEMAPNFLNKICSIRLEDTLTKVITDLLVDSFYSFNASPVNRDNRFILHITGTYADFSLDSDTLYLNTNGTVVFTNNSTNSDTYDWDFGDGAGNSNLKDPSYSYTSAGTFTVQLISSLGLCSDTSSKTLIVIDNKILNVKEQDIESLFSVHPNPTTGTLFIDYEPIDISDAYSITLNDMLGRQLFNINNVNNNYGRMEIDMNKYENGIYLINIKQKGAVSFSKRIVLNKPFD